MRSTVFSSLFFLAAAQAREASSGQPDSGTWTDQFKCSIDLESDQPSLFDESTCSTLTDANSQSCLWCDLSSLTGSGGVCVNSAIKELLGAYWDQLCIEGSASAVPDGPATPPVSPPLNPLPVPVDPPIPSPPSKLPTPSPVTTPPVAPAPDDGFSGAFSCATDEASRRINDEATCLAKTDVTSSAGLKCVWCPVPFVGGGCITNSDASSISWLCRGFHQIGEQVAAGKNTQNLRGNPGDIAVKGWETLDPSCLGDLVFSKDLDAGRESCATRNDKNGNSCIWCDGAGVLGYCVSPLQRDAFSDYMDCSDVTTAVDIRFQGLPVMNTYVNVLAL
ncbi:hypothetical protein ACHAWX_005615 [Stephanocyclus meneghinianus]